MKNFIFFVLIFTHLNIYSFTVTINNNTLKTIVNAYVKDFYKVAYINNMTGKSINNIKCVQETNGHSYFQIAANCTLKFYGEAKMPPMIFLNCGNTNMAWSATLPEESVLNVLDNEEVETNFESLDYK